MIPASPTFLQPYQGQILSAESSREIILSFVALPTERLAALRLSSERLIALLEYTRYGAHAAGFALSYDSARGLVAWRHFPAQTSTATLKARMNAFGNTLPQLLAFLQQPAFSVESVKPGKTALA